jgi:hypothetical protein
MSLVQSLWIGSRLSGQEILSIKSFLAHGHDYHLYIYDDIGPVPAGTVVKDAATILDRRHACRDQFGTYCFLADKFRYKLLRERGGWWVDTDIICVRPFTKLGPYFFCYATDQEVANTVLKAPPQSPFMAAVDAGAALVDEHIRWGVIGADLITQTLDEPQFQSLRRFIHPPNAIFPVPHTKWQYLFFKEFEDIPALIPTETYGIHLSNQMIGWNRKAAEDQGWNLDRDRRFPITTIFGYYQNLYL